MRHTTVPTHNKHTPLTKKSTFPLHKHFPHNKHNFFGLTKMCLLWGREYVVREKRIFENFRGYFYGAVINGNESYNMNHII